MASSSSSEDDKRLPKRVIVRMENKYIDEPIFRERFRFTQEQTEELLTLIGPHMKQARIARFDVVNPKQKLLAALRFYASGNFYYSGGDAQGLSKAVVSRAIEEVTVLINRILFSNVKWPTDMDECRAISAGFQDIAGVKNVCGAVDGTLVKIKTPSLNENSYVDRKHNHSLNVMAVCGPNLYFYFVSALHLRRTVNLCQTWRVHLFWRWTRQYLLGPSTFYFQLLVLLSKH